MSKKKDTRDKHIFFTAYKECLGVLSIACRVTGISRERYKELCAKYPGWEQELDVAHEERLDFAESKLIELVNARDFRAIKFLLETQGKKRGYFKAQSITLNVQERKGVLFEAEKISSDPETATAQYMAILGDE